MKRSRVIAGVLAALLLLGAGGGIPVALAAEVPAAASHSTSTSYRVEVTASSLNIRKGVGTGYSVVGSLKRGDTCVIVEERADSRGVSWGYLGDGRGWISLSYCRKLSGGESTEVNYTVEVTAGSLNIRKSASRTASITGWLSKGDKMTITAEQVDSRGVTWGKLKSGAGWVSLDYCRRTDGSDDSTSVNYTATVTAYSLNIRQSASKSAAVTGTLSKGDKVTIVAEQSDSRGVTWGKLKSGGWVSLAYCSKSDSGSGESNTVNYTVRVTAASLNIRKNASRTAAVTGWLSRGDVVTIVAEQKDSRGVTWGKLKSGAGWVSLEYCSRTDSSGGSGSSSEYTVTITAFSLNIRKSASNTSTVTGWLSRGEKVTIVDEQRDSRGVTWGKLKSGAGWINLDYSRKS